MRFVKIVCILILCLACLSTSGGRGAAQNNIQAPDNLDSRNMLRLQLVPLVATSCTQRKTEPQVDCKCTDSSGHTFTRKASCYSCYDAMSNQKCGGPYCDQCAVICDPKGAVPPQNKNPC
jgi:hypothetical protein